MRTVTYNNSSRVLNVCRGRLREPRPRRARTPSAAIRLARADFAPSRARAGGARVRLPRLSRGLRARRTCIPNAKSPPAPRGRLDTMIERRRGTGGRDVDPGDQSVGDVPAHRPRLRVRLDTGRRRCARGPSRTQAAASAACSPCRRPPRCGASRGSRAPRGRAPPPAQRTTPPQRDPRAA